METRQEQSTAPCAGKLHGHNFVGSACIQCWMTREALQEQFIGKRKEPVDQVDLALKSILNRQRNTRMHSQAHDVADQICRAFNEPKKFGQYLGMVKRLGHEQAWSIFRTIQQFRPPAKNPAAVFFFKSKKALNANNPQHPPEHAVR